MARGTDLQPLTSPLLQTLGNNVNACGAAGFFLLTLPQLEALRAQTQSQFSTDCLSVSFSLVLQMFYEDPSESTETCSHVNDLIS